MGVSGGITRSPWLDADLAGCLTDAPEDLSQEGPEGGSIAARHEGFEGTADQVGALQAEEARTGEVQLLDRPRSIQGEVPHRGKIVELRVLRERRLQSLAAQAQFLVLQLQLDLVHIELVHQALALRRDRPVGQAGALLVVQPSFRPAA